VNAAIRFAKRRHRLIELDPAQPAPAGALDHELDLRRLGHALARLDTRDRVVLTLRHYWELTVPEAAGALGLPEGTVKSRTYHALERLRAAYDAEDRR